MKKSILSMMALLAVVSLSAQDEQTLTPGREAQKAGNEAYNNKDYVTAISYYEKYLNSGEEGVPDDLYTLNLYQMSFFYAGNAFIREKNYEKAYEYYDKYRQQPREDIETDGKFWYQFANTARQIDKDQVALDTYKKCVNLNYNKDGALYSIAQMFYKDGQIDSMNVYLHAGLDGIEQSANRYYPRMLLLLTTQQLKEATDVMKVAQDWAQKAAGADVDTYLANMSKAVEYYKKAIPLYEEVLAYPGVDDKTKANESKARSSIEVCNTSISQYESYRRTIKK